jgi:F1F0 ATPase subunit 2
MNDLPYLLLMFIAGIMLAGVYLAGLWLSVKYLQTRKHPALWFVMSLVLRLGIVALAFYFILASGNLQHLLAALAGFVLLRALVIRRVRNIYISTAGNKEGVT